MINGRSVSLKALDSSCLPFLYKWRNDHDLMSFYGLSPIISIEKLQKEIQTNKALKNRLDFMVLTRGKNPIGMVWLKQIDWINRHCEINCMIGEKSHRANVFGPEAIFLLLLFCMNGLNLNKVYAKMVEFAEQSHALVTLAGFKKEAVLKKMVFQEGQYRDLFVYGLLQKEFQTFIKSPAGQQYRLSSRQRQKR